MKICMFVNNPISRDPRVKGEALALTKAGHEVTVIGTWQADLRTEEIWNGIKFLRVYTKNNIKKSIATLRAALKLPTSKNRFFEYYSAIRTGEVEDIWVKKATEEEYDVYHAHDLDTLNIAYLSSIKNNAKLVYDSHELWIEWQRNKNIAPSTKIEMWSKTEKDVVPKADLVITVSDGIANEIKNMYKLESKPLVIYNCADLKEYKRLNILREEYIDSETNKKIVLYQGGIQSGRGLENFIEIAKLTPDLDFVMIGPIPNESYGEHLKELAKGYTNIYILEPVPYDELWKITCSADFGYVCTEPLCKSYELGLSNKIFEYMVAGLPIIASNVPGHLELKNKLPDNLNPFYFIEHNDPEKSANMLKNTVSDHNTIESKRHNARYIAEQLYNRELEFSKLLEAYNNIK